MRIGIDVTKAVPPRDGIGNYAFHLVDALARVDERNEYLLYNLLAPVGEEALRAAFPRLPERFQLRAGGAPARDELDLFLATCWLAPPGVERVLFVCYDLTFLTHPGFHQAQNKLHCIEGTLRAALGGAHFLAISRATARSLIEELEVAEERIDVIHPAVDECFAPAPREEARARLRRRFDISRPFLLSVGTVEPRKNQLRLARAFESLPPDVTGEHELLLAGGAGWLNSELHRHLEARGGAGRVRALGYVSDEELVDLYSACTLFAYPSLAEGFGLPVLEALACGTAVVTSRTSSLPEVVGDAALLVDPEDERAIAGSLERLLTDETLARELRAKAIEQASRFSWLRTAREVSALCERLGA